MHTDLSSAPVPLAVSDISGFNTPEPVSHPAETPIDISSAAPRSEQDEEVLIQPTATPPPPQVEQHTPLEISPPAEAISIVELGNGQHSAPTAGFEDIKQDAGEDSVAAQTQQSMLPPHSERAEDGVTMKVDLKEEPLLAAEEANGADLVSEKSDQPDQMEIGDASTQEPNLTGQQGDNAADEAESVTVPDEAVKEQVDPPVRNHDVEMNHVEEEGDSERPNAPLPDNMQQVKPEVRAIGPAAASEAPESSSLERGEPVRSDVALVPKDATPEATVLVANTSESAGSAPMSAIEAVPALHPNKNSSTSMKIPSQSGIAVMTSQPDDAPNGSSSIQASIPAAESFAVAGRRQTPPRVSTEGPEKARQEELHRIQRENEDMRLMWLSLPANDHITYYSDTEEEGLGDLGEFNSTAPKGAYGGLPLLSGTKANYSNGKRKRQDWQEEERESSDSDDENIESQDKSEERRYRTGNRGNKLVKGARWNRRGKLGLWTEAKNEKDMHDRFMSRVKAIQIANIESLLYNAPGPKVIQEDGPLKKDLLEGSDRMLFRDFNSSSIVEENLQSTFLAPALLRPILSARALLESHTLRHTFRNPHIGALSKTALDLRESEGHLSRALGRCFSGMERISAYVKDLETGNWKVNGSQNTDYEIDFKAIGAEGTAGTADEVNPALLQLDNLFVTKNGLPIPVNSDGEEQGQSAEMQAVLTINQQRDVVRAALECLQDLGIDSLEYVERLDEVRGRLEAVKRRRTQVWEALRLWALKVDGEEDGEVEKIVVEEDEVANNRMAAKPSTTAVPSGNSTTKRRR